MAKCLHFRRALTHQWTRVSTQSGLHRGAGPAAVASVSLGRHGRRLPPALLLERDDSATARGGLGHVDPEHARVELGADRVGINLGRKFEDARGWCAVLLVLQVAPALLAVPFLWSDRDRQFLGSGLDADVVHAEPMHRPLDDA